MPCLLFWAWKPFAFGVMSSPTPIFGPKSGYAREDVLRLVGISERQLRAWERQEFVRPSAELQFSDILALKTLKKLRELRISTGTIRKAIDNLRERLDGVEHPLAQLRITAEGKRITVYVSGSRMDPISGQLLLDFDGATEVEKLRTMSQPDAAPKRTKAGDEESERWFQRGLALEETGAPVTDAVAAYRKAIEANPEAAGALVNLGTISFRMRKLREAENYYNRAMAADPEYPLAHFNLGNLHDELGHTEEARKYYQQALKRNPRYADAFFNLALLHEKNNELLQAISCWQSYLRLDTTSAWARTARKQLDRLKKTVRHK